MTTTSLTITEANIGEMIGPPDGFLVNLTMTTGPVHETARWDEGRQKWLSAYFVLRGSHDLRDLVCVDAATNGHAFAWWGSDARQPQRTLCGRARGRRRAEGQPMKDYAERRPQPEDRRHRPRPLRPDGRA